MCTLDFNQFCWFFQVAQSFENTQVEYFNTFGGNPVCCAAGLAVLEQIKDLKLQENALIVGELLKKELILLKEKVEICGKKVVGFKNFRFLLQNFGPKF